MKQLRNKASLDWHHQNQCGQCEIDKFYDEVEAVFHDEDSGITQKAKTCAKCLPLAYALREFMYLRFTNPAAADLLALKIITNNAITYDEALTVLKGCTKDYPDIPNGPTKILGRHRQRISELAQDILNKFPQLENLMGVHKKK
jgi:hypothetical protein